ncbi:MAG: beta-ketoacyl-[acyl-carrier-protein] synthase family protein [Gemmataceae bacterium]
MSPRRVVVTGLGPISPIGLGFAAFRTALLSERSGVHLLQLFDATALPVRFGGEIEEFDARDFLDKKDRKQLKLMVRTIQLAVAAARLAREDARLGSEAIDPERLGIVLGTGIIPGDLNDLGPAAFASYTPWGIDLRLWGTVGIDQIPPMWMLNHVPNMPACHVAILHNARGPNNTIVQHDAASLMALIEATRYIQRDAADVVFAGGTDTRTNQTSIVRALLFSRLSRRNDEPETACRPFGKDRDGQVLGEGAGVVVLEERQHALRRGARIYAEIVGYGWGFDHGLNDGLRRAMATALRRAGIRPTELDHVNAAANGSLEDASEAAVLGELGGELPVLAPKAALGNLGNAGSVVEWLASLSEPGDRRVPASLQARFTDAAFGVNVIQEMYLRNKPYGMKIAQTDRGQAAALVFRWED